MKFLSKGNYKENKSKKVSWDCEGNKIKVYFFMFPKDPSKKKNFNEPSGNHKRAINRHVVFLTQTLFYYLIIILKWNSKIYFIGFPPTQKIKDSVKC